VSSRVPNRTVVGGGPAVKVSQLVFGRDANADVAIDHPTISGRHARLVYAAEGLVLEDLGSTNGTWLRGERIARALVHPGDDVLLGGVLLPWSDPRVQGFARRASGTMAMPARAAGSATPRDASRAKGGAFARVFGQVLSLVATVLVGAVVVYALVRLNQSPARPAIVEAITGGEVEADDGTTSEIESAIRAQRAPGIVTAMDPNEATTRNTAVKIAAAEPGAFNIEQVARIWTHVRGRWRYVNDPRGGEYFARASESIANEYAGDCDDFAIVLSAMLGAIGGNARVVLMNGPAGGHAYAEVCVPSPVEEVVTRLSRHYRRKWDPYVGRQRITNVHYRSDEMCPLWLNLDWNARVPGGPYEAETWAVAVNPDGSTRTLAPATGPDAGTPAPSAAGSVVQRTRVAEP
jgi:hypothetical protein